MEHKYIQYRGINIHYKISGKGLTVVLIHGFAEDSTIWDHQSAFLQDNYQVIVPDLPGSGGSELLKIPLINGKGTEVKPRDISLEDYAECIKKILDKEQVARCMMIGHSMGGYIGLAFATHYPDMLSAFGLFHSSAYADDEAKIETRKKAMEFIKSNGADAFLKTSIPGLFMPGNTTLANTLIEKGKTFTSDALIQYYQAMIDRPDRTQLLKDLTIPVLFVMGEHDKAVPFKHSLEQSHMPGHAYIHILRNSAHMGMLEEPHDSNEILANFLQSL